MTLLPETSISSLASIVVLISFRARQASSFHTALVILSSVSLRFSLLPASRELRKSRVKKAASLIHSLIAGRQTDQSITPDSAVAPILAEKGAAQDQSGS